MRFISAFVGVLLLGSTIQSPSPLLGKSAIQTKCEKFVRNFAGGNSVDVFFTYKNRWSELTSDVQSEETGLVRLSLSRENLDPVTSGGQSISTLTAKYCHSDIVASDLPVYLKIIENREFNWIAPSGSEIIVLDFKFVQLLDESTKYVKAYFQNPEILKNRGIDKYRNDFMKRFESTFSNFEEGSVVDKNINKQLNDYLASMIEAVSLEFQEQLR